MSVPSTAPTSLGESAYRRLRDDIVSCRLAPGERLTERALAATTGYGMSPIRDALTRLDHEGLVRTLPRKGYQVTPLTLKSVDDMFALWRIVGPEIVRLGVQEATPEQRGRAVEALRAADAAAGDPTTRPGRLSELSGEAFGALAEASDNDYLIGIYLRLSNDLARVWTIAGQSGAALPEISPAEELATAIERRDGAAAAAHVAAFVAEAHSRMLRILSRWPSVVASEITPLPR